MRSLTRRVVAWAPARPDLRVLGRYAAYWAVFVAIGVVQNDVLLSFWTGAAYLFLVAWAVPALVRRLR